MNEPYNATRSVRESKLIRLSGQIIYVVPVEDGDPDKASVLQGFAPSLIRNTGLVQLINTLPSDVWELTPEGQKVGLARRVSGQAPIMWRGQSPTALTSVVTPPFFPFLVLFLGEDHKISTYKDWIGAHTFPVTVVAERDGSIAYEDFCLEALRNSFLRICEALKGQVEPKSLAETIKQLQSWEEPASRVLGYKVGGHNAFAPNLLALNAAGFRDTVDGEFKRINEGITPYVEVISNTTQSILKERKRVGERMANQYFRQPPSINLFAPAIYPHIYEANIGDASFTGEEKKRFLTVLRALQRQDGYAFNPTSELQALAIWGALPGEKLDPHPLLRLRASELRLASDCVGTLAASEVSAVIRLPNSVNRTAGQVRQFAQHYHAKRTTDRKRRESFRKVQHRITESVPQEFMEFVEGASNGIRLISNAHLEWMNVKGLPLCVQKDVCKIPVTPGNLFIEQVLPVNYLHLEIADFEEVLILTAIHDDDPISPFLQTALKGFAPHFRDRIKLRIERVRTQEDIVSALNSFSGALMIFDGHGSHEKNSAAKLHLLDEEIDVWQLRKQKVRVPPIVVLSACDTHAADRNHASAANGFLSLGVRTVLGTTFPIDAIDAAALVARLLHRVAEFVPAAHKSLNRSLTWMEIMGGMVRMQLLTDFCLRLLRKGLLDDQGYNTVHLAGNMSINTNQEWPFDTVIAEITKLGIDEKRAWVELQSAVANSTALSYIQLGRPETIIVHPDNGFVDETLLSRRT